VSRRFGGPDDDLVAGTAVVVGGEEVAADGGAFAATRDQLAVFDERERQVFNLRST
jgi:pyruvate/2-oxoglutarate/acetoin dehydrogenase E1 component